MADSKTNLKGILKRNINRCNDDSLGEKLSDILNDYCDTEYVWYCDDKSLIIEIDLDEQDKIIKFIEDLVGCSYISETCDTTGLLILSFTISTLVKKLEEVNEDGYAPLKVERFIKREHESRRNKAKTVSIVDTKVLVGELFSQGYADNGVIFTANTPSEWVNHEIADEVLKLLSTERSFTQMIDNCIGKED